MSENKVRAEIIETGNPKVKSAHIVIQAAPSAIFSILANPQKHKDIDGSSTITANISGPKSLYLVLNLG